MSLTVLARVTKGATDEGTKPMAETLTSKQVAETLGTDPKQLRVFLRSGNGDGLFSRDGRAYVFSPKDVSKIKAAYAKWEKARADERKAKAEASTPEAEE